MEIVNKGMSEEELVAAVRQALATPASGEADGFLTTRELESILKCKPKRLRPILRQMWQDGLLESRQVQRMTYTGPYGTTGYRFISKETSNGTPQ